MVSYGLDYLDKPSAYKKDCNKWIVSKGLKGIKKLLIFENFEKPRF